MTQSHSHVCAPRLPAGFSVVFRLVLATTAALWLGTASAQAIAPPSAVINLSFQEFFRSPISPTGMEIGDALRKANGQTVRLVGYMVQQEKMRIGRFMLTPRPVQMSEHADGEADDLPAATVMVYLDKAQEQWAVPHVRGLVELQGVVSVGRFEEADGRVSWVRLQLAPDATQTMNSYQVAGYLHSLQHRH